MKKNSTKAISEMTEDEILRKQMEILADRSKKCGSVNKLSRITDSMVNLSNAIKFKTGRI